MNSALESLRRSNPSGFDQVMRALAEEFGVATSGFTCPNCHSKLEIRVIGQANGRKTRSVARQQARLSGDGLNDLLIQLARIRRTTTGTINADFKKLFGKKIRKLDKKEQRAQKVQWLKAELSKRRAA